MAKFSWHVIYLAIYRLIMAGWRLYVDRLGIQNTANREFRQTNRRLCLESSPSSWTECGVGWNAMLISFSTVRWVEGGPRLEWSPHA